MTKAEALEAYCAKNRTAVEAVRRLMAWNPRGTIYQNAQELGVSVANADQFARRYGLEYVKAPKGGARLVDGRWVFDVKVVRKKSFGGANR